MRSCVQAVLADAGNYEGRVMTLSPGYRISHTNRSSSESHAKENQGPATERLLRLVLLLFDGRLVFCAAGTGVQRCRCFGAAEQEVLFCSNFGGMAGPIPPPRSVNGAPHR